MTSSLRKISSKLLRQAKAGVSSVFFVSTFGRIVSQILAAATVFVAAQFVSLEDFGVLALGQAVTIILASLLYTGLHHQVMRSTNLGAENATLFAAQCLLGLAGALMMAAIGALQSPGSVLQSVFFLMAPIPAFVAPAAHFEALLIRAQKIRVAVLSTMVAEILGFVAMWLAFVQGAGVFALVLGRLVATIVAFAAKVWFAGVWPGLKLDARIAHEAFFASRPLYLTTGTSMASNYGGDLLLGLFLNPLSVGAFRAASRVATTGSEIIAKPVQTITWSNLARLEREQADASMAAAWLDHAKFLTLLAWPALCALALMSGSVVDLLLDESWSAAAPVISVLALALAVGILDNIVAPALTCTKQGQLYERIALATAAVIVASLSIAAPFGAVAAAFGLLFARLMMAPIALYYVLKALDVSVGAMIRNLAPSLGVTAACGVVVFLLQNVTSDTIEGFVVTAGLGALFWIALFFTLVARGLVQYPQP